MSVTPPNPTPTQPGEQPTSTSRSRFSTRRIEVVQRSHPELLDLLGSLGSALGSQEDSSGILATLNEHIRQIVPFRLTAFLLHEPNRSPVIARCDPPTEVDWIRSEIDAMIRDGKYDWARRQARAVLLHGSDSGDVLVLHGVATRATDYGMFAGLVDGGAGPLDRSAMRMLSAFLLQGAYAIENAALSRTVREHAVRLEQVVEQRTRQLTRALQIAEESSRAKSQFLANMSHEIRTPLNGIIGTAELLHASGLNHYQRDLATTLLECGDQLLGIISDILDFSKIESGKLSIQIAPFSIRQCVSDVFRTLQAAADRKGLQLKFDPAPDCPAQVAGDELRVRQILTNLVGNAVKFSWQGCVTVSAKPAKFFDAPDGSRTATIEFRVGDQGIGIAAEKIAELFRPFSQVDPSKTRLYGGTGLGLAICRSLCELMGGDIGVESEEGRGSSFHFRLHLPVLAQPETPPVAQTQPGPHKATHDNRPLEIHPIAKDHPLRLLVVSASLASHVILTRMLAQLGYHPQTAMGAAELPAKIGGEKFDAILLDAHLPELSGHAIIRTIRSNYHRIEERPALVLFGLESGDADRDEYAAIGVSACLPHPLTKASLRDTLLRLPPLTAMPE